MNQVGKVSLGGYAFTLTEDAMSLCKDYILRLEKFYGTLPDGREILDAIEERLAELLLEKCPGGEVVTRDVVQGAISVLGEPEEIGRDSGEGQEGPGSSEDAEGTKKRGKRLYRNLSDKVLGGVCSGLGDYFNVDRVIVRVIFVVWFFFPIIFPFAREDTFFTIPTLAYIILWIAIPSARTVEQKYSQQGRPLDIEGIRSSIGEQQPKVYGQKLVSTTGRVLGIAVGIILLLVGFSGLCACTFSTVGAGWLGLSDYLRPSLSSLAQISPRLVTMTGIPGIRILAFVVVLLPFVGMLYGGCQLIFGFKSPRWHPGLVIFILWLLCLVALGVIVVLGVLPDAGML